MGTEQAEGGGFCMYKYWARLWSNTMNTTTAIVSKETMKRSSKDNNAPLIFALLLASLLLSTGNSGCVLVEARIPHFSDIQRTPVSNTIVDTWKYTMNCQVYVPVIFGFVHITGSLKSDIYGRSLRPNPPTGTNSPDPNGRIHQGPINGGWNPYSIPY